MEIKLEKGQVQVEVAIIKADTDYDLTAFRQKLKNRGLTAPKIPRESVERLVTEVVDPRPMDETKSDLTPAQTKPKKLKKIKLPGKKIDRSLSSAKALGIKWFLEFYDGKISLKNAMENNRTSNKLK